MNQLSKASSVQPQQIERVAIFIDGANLYAASRTLGFDVDYKNLLAHFRQRSYLVRAYYYTALLETEVLPPPATGGLARLQRLLGGDQAGQGVHRRHRA